LPQKGCGLCRPDAQIDSGGSVAEYGAAVVRIAESSFVSWDQRFFDPIMLPGQKRLLTLRDAAQYIIKLPKAERELPQLKTAIECLMLVGEHGNDPMVPRIAMMKALRRHHQPKASSAPRRKRAKAYRIIR
jgi:hypothetical protein